MQNGSTRDLLNTIEGVEEDYLSLPYLGLSEKQYKNFLNFLVTERIVFYFEIRTVAKGFNMNTHAASRKL